MCAHLDFVRRLRPGIYELSIHDDGDDCDGDDDDAYDDDDGCDDGGDDDGCDDDYGHDDGDVLIMLW